MLGGIGIPELIVIFAIVLLFFGAKRLPEIGKSLGKGIRDFQDSLKGIEDEVNREIPPGDTRGSSSSTQQSPHEPSEHKDQPQG
jgi:sec-independent protein translocase protein TatA